jgi:hypothetical protein
MMHSPPKPTARQRMVLRALFNSNGPTPLLLRPKNNSHKRAELLSVRLAASPWAARRRWRTTRLLTTILFCICLPTASRGDGLLYRLPADGTSARFELTFDADLDGTTIRGTGFLEMSSVGQTAESGRMCRWIELKFLFQTEGRRGTYLTKLLIPEDRLKKGEAPLDHVVRAWIKHDDGDTVPLDDPQGHQAGLLSVFLGGPLENVAPLAPQNIETKLGPFEAGGLTGTQEFDDGKLTTRIAHKLRLHDTAPFGVIAADLQFEVRREGEEQGIGRLHLKLVETGTNAASALPKNN